MTEQYVPNEAPEPTETFEQYDEVAEGGSTGSEEDPGATGVSGSEADLTRLTEMPVDQLANEEVGAQLDDPESMALLDGGVDDPDGIDPGDQD